MQDNQFPKRLSLLLKHEKISQRDFAALVGITESAVCHYLKGDRSPNAQTLVAIALATHVSPTWLVGFGNSNKIERI